MSCNNGKSRVMARDQIKTRAKGEGKVRSTGRKETTFVFAVDFASLILSTSFDANLLGDVTQSDVASRPRCPQNSRGHVPRQVAQT